MCELFDAWGIPYDVMDKEHRSIRPRFPIQCQHYDEDVGCTIYDKRPRVCREYVCTNPATPFKDTPWNRVWKPEMFKEEEHGDTRN